MVGNWESYIINRNLEKKSEGIIKYMQIKIFNKIFVCAFGKKLRARMMVMN